LASTELVVVAGACGGDLNVLNFSSKKGKEIGRL